MDCDPGILCLQHCGPSIFCFEVPEYCPVCRKQLKNHNPPVTPVRVPYPFVRAYQYTCAVLIKPTNGDFLNDYKMSMNLHIGITTSTGKIVEYDQTGLHTNRISLWNQCLIITQESSEQLIEQWDDILNSVTAQDCWTSQRYHEETFNCYTFVLAFLQCLRDSKLREAAKNKVHFCEIYVLPRTTLAYKYISLFRILKDSRYYVNSEH